MNYLPEIAFWSFATLIIASAATVVFSKKIIYSAFALLFTFFGVAGLYVLLNSDFLAITQIMIYIGGILVLIIFGVMLTSKMGGFDVKVEPLSKAKKIAAGIVVLAVAIGLIALMEGTPWISKGLPEVGSVIKPLGKALLTDYLLAFEAASVLLLIAIVGAAFIARRK